MHTMGLIDLYDTGEPLGEAEGIGIWCLMASPYGLNGRGYPLMMSAWSRWDANWLEPILIVKDDTYQIQAAALSDDAYRINLNDPSTGQPAEYLLIENRQQVGFDENLPGAGLIIYHIDDAADDMKNRGYPGQEGEVPWPQNGNHYRVAVLPFDGNYDLEQDVNKGDAGDMWMAGSELGPGMGNTIFPNTDSYQNGTIRETGITIKVVEQVGTDILFEVIGVGNANTPGIATDSPSNQPSATTPTTDSPSNQPSATTPTTVSPTVSPGTPTAVPTQAPSQGPTRPGFNEDWWVLTREPSPSRSPVNLPEFPVGESVNDLAEIGNARSSGIASLKGGGWVCSPFLLLLVGSSLYLMSL